MWIEPPHPLSLSLSFSLSLSLSLSETSGWAGNCEHRPGEPHLPDSKKTHSEMYHSGSKPPLGLCLHSRQLNYDMFQLIGILNKQNRSFANNWAACVNVAYGLSMSTSCSYRLNQMKCPNTVLFSLDWSSFCYECASKTYETAKITRLNVVQCIEWLIGNIKTINTVPVSSNQAKVKELAAQPARFALGLLINLPGSLWDYSSTCQVRSGITHHPTASEASSKIIYPAG